MVPSTSTPTAMKYPLPLLALAALLLGPMAHAQIELSFAPYFGYNLTM